jgi:type II secretory pathway component GspD/PulD (secretin)
MLSRLPLLGGLFKNVHDENKEREIILILRPLILGEMDPCVPVMPQVRNEIDQSMWEKILEEPAYNPILNH